MEPFDKLTVKLKSHVWCMIFFSALMIFWITAFSVSGKGDNIASWLSILFAVVVIVYMLIQGHEMRNLVEEGHRLMAEKAGTMADKAEKVAEESKSMLQRMNYFFKSFERPASKIVPSEPLESDKLRFNASNARIYTLLTLYAAAQSFKHNKPMLIDKISTIFEEVEKDKITDDTSLVDFIAFGLKGILLGLECFLEPHSLIMGTTEWYVEIKNLPPEFEEHISKELKRRATEPPISPEYTDFVESSKRNIDAYFAEL